MDLTHEGHQRRLGLLLAFGTLIWSGTYGAFGKGLTPFLSPMTLLILTEFLTAFFIIFTFGLFPLLKELRKMNRASVLIAVLVGLISSAVAPMLWFVGLSMTSAMNASLLSATEMIAIIVLSRFFLGERISSFQAMGGMIAAFGILIINLWSNGNHFEIQLGDVLITLGAITWALGAVIFKKYLSHIMPELSLVIRNFSGIVAVSIISLLIGHSFTSEISVFPTNKIFLLLCFGFFSRYLSLTFFYEALERIPATTLSLINIGSPVAGLFFANLILGEKLHIYQLVGGIFIVFGLGIEQVSRTMLTSVFRHGFFGFIHRKPRLIAVDPMHIVP